ncbi:MAG: Rieske 2Fe-2S domain-containing protein, partial [Actinomycetota bacterium]
MATKVCALADLEHGKARKFDVGGRAVAVVRIDDIVYAIGDRCSHAD